MLALAFAMTIKNGMVQYVGSKRVAKSLCDDKTVIEDYGTNSVYPGFIDVHVHPLAAVEDGPDRICVDADGNPTGVIKEETERIAAGRVPDMEEERDKIHDAEIVATAVEGEVVYPIK